MLGSTRHRLVRAGLDWLAPLTVLAIGVVHVANHPHSKDYPGPPLAHVGYLIAAIVALGLRRRAPIVAPFAAIVITTAWSLMWPDNSQGPFEGFLVLVGAAYSLGILNRGRRLIVSAVLLAAYFLVGQVVILASGGRDGDLLPLLVWILAGFVVGALISRRTQQAHDARRQNVFLEVDHQRRMAEAVEDERARIARELHDVVAHSLSVIVVQAAAERRALGHGSADAASMDGVLGSVERTGREALVDLRRLLGLLRQTDEPPALAPQPSLAELDVLVDQVRDADVEVDVHIEGDQVPLPTGVDLTAYRIVQESLTNVLKHAGAHRVRICIAYRRNQLEVAVSDDGRTAGEAALSNIGAGHGLLGMRERVSVFGGTVSAGHGPNGGWTVQASLPIQSVSVDAT
jgi:signal transduction histidine kinase